MKKSIGKQPQIFTAGLYHFFNVKKCTIDIFFRTNYILAQNKCPQHPAHTAVMLITPISTKPFKPSFSADEEQNKLKNILAKINVS